MTDNIENLIIEQLKAIRNDVREFRQVNSEEHSDIKARLASLESAIVSVKRNEADTSADIARQQVSIDSLAARLERLERRLELVG